MKKNKQRATILFSALAFASAFSAQADFSVPSRAIVREGKKLKELPVVLKDLDSSDRFQGRYFTIVRADSNDAVPIVPGTEETLRASTVYHHLTVARDYAKSLEYFDSPHLEIPAVIRIEMTKEYNRSTHFVPESEIFNNCWSIAGSDDHRADGIDAWGNEIWFFKAKKIRRKSGTASLGSVLSSNQFTNSLVSSLLIQDVQGVSMAVAQGRFDAPEHLTSMLFSIGLGELLPRAMGFGLSKVKQTQYLDTAMIPEIIYHEYGHLLFGHRLGFRLPTQLVEGYPNYFAAKVAGRDILADHDGRYGRGFVGKKSHLKNLYSADLEESMQAAFGSFTFSVLMQLEEKLGAEGEKILFKTGLDAGLDSGTHLANGFDWALFEAIDRYGSDPETLKVRAATVFDRRGL